MRLAIGTILTIIMVIAFVGIFAARTETQWLMGMNSALAAAALVIFRREDK